MPTLAGNLTLPLDTVSGTMLVLIPPACHCAAYRQVADRVRDERARARVSGGEHRGGGEWDRPAWCPASAAAAREHVSVALDGHGDLHAVAPFTGLIVVLVSPVGMVSYARGLTPGESTVPLRNALTA